MLFWAGTKPSLLLLLGSPAIGLILAFSTVAWGAWIILLFALLLWWRPYVWEGLTVMLANVFMGVIAVPFWRRLAPYQQNRLLAFQRHYEALARPFEWTFTRRDLARLLAKLTPQTAAA